MIRPKNQDDEERIIDLTGPDGNAYVLLGIAHRAADQLGKDWDRIQKEMTEKDYDHLILVFEKEFGDYFTLLT